MQLQQSWDLNGDGVFDDATGPVAHIPSPPADAVVRLKVTDGDGASDVAEQTLSAPAPLIADPIRVVTPSAAATPSVVAPRAMSPFPVVRMRGRLTRRGVFVELLSVAHAPADARIAISCRGKGCPKRMSLRSATGALRAGTVLEVRITAPGTIGKVVRFTIRRGKPWLRRDGCLSRPARPRGACDARRRPGSHLRRRRRGRPDDRRRLGGAGTKTVPTVPAPRDTYTIAGLARLRQDPPIPRFLLERAAPPRPVVHRAPARRVARRAVVSRPAPAPVVRVAVPAPVPVPTPAPVHVAVQRPIVKAPAPKPAPAKPPIVFDDSG